MVVEPERCAIAGVVEPENRAIADWIVRSLFSRVVRSLANLLLDGARMTTKSPTV